MRIVKLVGVAIGLGVLVTILASLGADVPSGPTPEMVADAQAMVARDQRAGRIRNFTCTGNTAEVEPAFWAALDAQGKRGVTISLAAVCHGQQSGYRITVLDAQSGRQLAEFSGGSVTFR